MQNLRYLLPLLLVLLFACENKPAASTDAEPASGEKVTSPTGGKTINLQPKTLALGNEPNPHAEGFNLNGSDNMAIQLADSIVKYHGGRKAWDEVQYLSWNFFGARTLLWDKHNSRVRIDVPQENAVYLLDYSGEEIAGRVRKLGNEITDPAALAADLKKANSMFINDAFWLVHQFKLKDTGVTLRYAGEARTDPQAQRPSHIIDQTFDGVGDTPDNRYRLYVDKVTYRINTWQFFRDADDTEPAMETPWNAYRPYGNILLSGDRGGRFQLSDISVRKVVDKTQFTEF